MYFFSAWAAVPATIIPAIILAGVYIFKLIYKSKNDEVNKDQDESLLQKEMEKKEMKDAFENLSSLIKTSQSDLSQELLQEKENAMRQKIKEELDIFYQKLHQQESTSFEREKQRQSEMIERLHEKIRNLTEERQALSAENRLLASANVELQEAKQNYSLFIDFYLACKDWGLSEIDDLKNFLLYWRENADLIEYARRKARKRLGPQEGGKESEKDWVQLFNRTFEDWPSSEFELFKQPKDQLNRRADFKVCFSSGQKHVDKLGILKILIELKTSNKRSSEVKNSDIKEFGEQIIKLLEETRFNDERFDIALFIVADKLIPQILGDEDVVWLGLGGEEEKDTNWYIRVIREKMIQGDPILALTSYEYSHILLKNLFYSWRMFAISTDHKIFSKSRDIRRFEERIPNLNRQALSWYLKTSELKDDLYEKFEEVVGQLWDMSEKLRRWMSGVDAENDKLKMSERNVYEAIEWVKSITIKHDQNCTCDSCEQKRWSQRGTKTLDIFRKDVRRRTLEHRKLSKKVERENMSRKI